MSSINSPLAKVTSSGQIVCIVCNAPVKSNKVWTAHINSRKHIENVAAWKKEKAAESNRIKVDKRKLIESVIESESPPMKKDRQPESNSNGKEMYSTEIDMEEANSSNNIDEETPWHLESQQKQKARRPEPPKANTIEVLPRGFFDDPKEDRKVRNAPDPAPHLDEEYVKFQKEMEQVEQEKLESALEEDEDEVVAREVESIDAQIMQWTRLNELEKKKDVLQVANELLRARAEERRKQEAEDSQIDPTDADLEELMDWRVKSV